MKTIGTSIMKLDRVTKGAILYKSVVEGDSEVLTSIYLRKSGLSEPYPNTVTITAAVED